ncbi:MAG TPA: hypothetical protein DIT29_08325 [Pseudothermotoga sp.]|nr:hypothetical protein [Pseudothermotoga sp.]HBT39661.1 hypothetical protein [Pseudothermotoga sp.]HCO98703.1 hypothetical protein [Pseudothermotoga sp.]
MKRCVWFVAFILLSAFLWAQSAILIDDGWVRLSLLSNMSRQYPYSTGYVIEVRALNPNMPVEVSYLMIDNTGTPQQPSTNFVMKGSNFDPPWDGSCFFKTEVGGWAQAEFAQNPRYLPLPHYRTCVLLLARYENIYAVFLRENDGQVGYRVLKGGPFTNFEIPSLARVERQGNDFVISSLGQPVEVGMWAEGRYTHDEVGGWASPSYAARTKRYSIPHYQMFMLMIGRYDRLALIMGKENDGRLGVIVFTRCGSLSQPGVVTTPDRLCRVSAQRTNLTVVADFNIPVEITHFSFDNTSWQWEVGGWANPGYAARIQTFTLKHYTPGLIVFNRYENMAVIGYNENDGIAGYVVVSGDILQ